MFIENALQPERNFQKIEGQAEYYVCQSWKQVISLLPAKLDYCSSQKAPFRKNLLLKDSETHRYSTSFRGSLTDDTKSLIDELNSWLEGP